MSSLTLRFPSVVIAKKSKQVCLYSTVHRDQQIHRSGKPKMITDYNQTKFAVDIYDEMINRYTYKPPVRRWPMRLFMNFLVDGGATNAYVLFGGTSSRREFIHNLADQLMAPLKMERARTEHKTKKTFLQISTLYDSLQTKSESPRWCHICNKVGRGDHIRSCSKCEKLACEDHIAMLLLCANCSRTDRNEQLRPPKPLATYGYCHLCRTKSEKRCKRCKKNFCKKHASSKDHEKCSECR